MANKKVEMTVELKENGQHVEHIAYPFVEYDHVTMENGMDIMSMIRDDVSTPMVTHNTTSWKVGQGDGDVSESIVDSSVGDMTIKGQTYQNILPSPSLRNSMTNGKTMQKLNEGYDSVNTVDGVCKSAILKGNTLVNKITNPTNNSYEANTKIVFSWNSKFLNVYHCYNVTNWSREITVISTTGKPITVEWLTDNGSTVQWGGVVSSNIINKKLTLPSNCTSISISGLKSDGWSLDNVQQANVLVLDGHHTVENIPYFEGMQSVKMPVLTTVGKNLFNENLPLENWFIDSSGNKISSASYEWINQECFVSGGESLIVSYKNRVGNATVRLAEYGEIGFIKRTNLSNNKSKITLTANTKRVIFSIDKRTNYFEGLQIEHGTVVTSYEPFKSNILSTPEEVVLKGIGDIQDTLNCNTGEYVERLGEVEITGNEEFKELHRDGSCIKSSFDTSSKSVGSNGGLMCDKLPINNRLWSNSDVEGIRYHDKTIHIAISKDKLETPDVEGIKNYIKSIGGLRLIYKEPVPTVKTVDLSILDQDNQPIKQLNSFANGYIQVSSQEGTLIPTTEYEVPTSNSYYVDLMKPSTQYTMKNMQGTFTIDGIQYNASVNDTFTSPSTLNNRLMITNVVQTQPMLLEGDITSKEVPYVEGIKSTFEGVDKVEIYSVGKNLVSSDWEKGRINNTTGENQNSEFHIRCKGFIRVNNCETYTWSNKNTLFKTVYEYDRDKNYLGVYHTYSSKFRTFTVSEKTEYIRVWEQTTEFDETTQIEQGTQATTFEPYKSNTTSFQLPHPLHSLPNGVRDEIVLDRVNHKAKIIQRVGEDLTQLETPIITEVNLEGYPYVYKGGYIFLNTEIAPITEVAYSINQAHQIESSNEDILRHQKEINHLYELIAQYVQVQYEAELIDIALQG